MLNSAKGVLRMLTCQRPPTAPHTILAGVSGVLKPGGCFWWPLRRGVGVVGGGRGAHNELLFFCRIAV